MDRYGFDSIPTFFWFLCWHHHLVTLSLSLCLALFENVFVNRLQKKSQKRFWCKNKITKKSFCMKNDFFPPYYTGKNHFLWWKSLFGKKPFFIFFCIIRAWSVLLKFFGRVWVQFSGIVKMSSVPPSAYCKPKQIISWENPLIDHYFVLYILLFGFPLSSIPTFKTQQNEKKYLFRFCVVFNCIQLHQIWTF